MAFKKGHIPWNKGLEGYNSGKNHYPKTHSEKTKQKIRESRKNLSDEARENYSKANKGCKNPMYGKKLSDEAKERISKVHRGKKLSKKHKQSISKQLEGNTFWVGRKHTEESKQKMSAARKGIGHPHTKETKKKMSIAHTGKKLSEETKKKLSIYNQERFKNKENHPSYGNKHSVKSKRKMRLYVIKRIQDVNGQAVPFYNTQACNFFEKLNKDLSLNGHHAENGGEHHIKELGYWLDYYEPNLNLVIEWDEKGHYDGNVLKEKDQLRQQEITEHLDCTFLRIRQNGNLNAQLNLITIYTEILQSRV